MTRSSANDGRRRFRLTITLEEVIERKDALDERIRLDSANTEIIMHKAEFIDGIFGRCFSEAVSMLAAGMISRLFVKLFARTVKR